MHPTTPAFTLISFIKKTDAEAMDCDNTMICLLQNTLLRFVYSIIA